MSNELKANIADAQKFFDKTKCTSFAEVMVQYANSRPTEPKEQEPKMVSVEYYDVKNDCQHRDEVPFGNEGDTLWINSAHHHCIIKPICEEGKTK